MSAIDKFIGKYFQNPSNSSPFDYNIFGLGFDGDVLYDNPEDPVTLTKTMNYNNVTLDRGLLNTNCNIIRCKGKMLVTNEANIYDWMPSSGKNGNDAPGNGAATKVETYSDFLYSECMPYFTTAVKPCNGSNGNTANGTNSANSGSQPNWSANGYMLGGNGGNAGDSGSNGSYTAGKGQIITNTFLHAHLIPAIPLNLSFGFPYTNNKLVPFGGAPGGSAAGGAGDGTNKGGGGGGGAYGGGIICIYAKILQLDEGYFLDLRGGNGGKGATPTVGNAGGGGAGGGGGGGFLYIVATKIIGEINIVTDDFNNFYDCINLTPGAGGIHGNGIGTGNPGQDGQPGQPGHVFIYETSTGRCWNV